MKLLLDESLPKRLKREFAGYDVVTVPEAGWAGCSNGELLRLAAERFDVLITADLNLRYQQNLEGSRLAIIVLRGRTNRLDDLRPLIPKIVRSLEGIQAGQVTEVSDSLIDGLRAGGEDLNAWPRTLKASSRTPAHSRRSIGPGW